MTLIGVFLLYLATPNIGPVIRAARADGVAGTFTAERLYCVQHPGHESCSWIGTFRSDDATVRRAEVAMYDSGRESHRAGTETRAIDVGRPNRVYGPQGSGEWMFTALLLVGGVAILAYLYVPPLMRLVSPRAVR
ncbi:hypothetical protein AB0B45_38365 [Nonomuraea sp. NPDC049152]|uniref:hypothetical protein n=1 Tax=Nonomuraea sp. NPDC049152 TaxID=3154350 RepID=UPI0033BFED2F